MEFQQDREIGARFVLALGDDSDTGRSFAEGSAVIVDAREPTASLPVAIDWTEPKQLAFTKESMKCRRTEQF